MFDLWGSRERFEGFGLFKKLRIKVISINTNIYYFVSNFRLHFHTTLKPNGPFRKTVFSSFFRTVVSSRHAKEGLIFFVFFRLGKPTGLIEFIIQLKKKIPYFEIYCNRSKSN